MLLEAGEVACTIVTTVGFGNAAAVAKFEARGALTRGAGVSYTGEIAAALLICAAACLWGAAFATGFEALSALGGGAGVANTGKVASAVRVAATAVGRDAGIVAGGKAHGALGRALVVDASTLIGAVLIGTASAGINAGIAAG